jgi:lipopolysaccharide/colanic/teichoic acid biosynthesis glycosyltransferase
MAGTANDLLVSGAAQGADRAKFLFDICAAALGLAICALPFAAVALAIRCEGRGAIFFRQRRVGKDGRVFRIWKFRTMRETTSQPKANLTVAGDQRITRVGAVLRATKIDELPQLINVLTGDMSLVGPRPETEDWIVHYTPAQRAVMLSIRPGVTDFASIALRHESELLAAAKDPLQYYRETLMPIKYDLCERYIREMGLWTDIKIIFATLATVVRRRPAAAPATEAQPGRSAK